ncbi:MAG: OmcA/MtrC family decaheme c-type cytochrome, partial [Gammaproteobacteria bacterium]|nr:OmcA/MtrC family decaheme c-type cytochrome [Gammaproteobacteria bacterium]
RVGLEIRLDGAGEVPLAPFNPVYDWVPDGGAGPGVTKLIADTNNCANCHIEFTMHGGPRKSVEYCVTCHNPGTVDQDSGNSLDLAHLAHSIHMGEDRLFGGTVAEFVIWGFSDFSHPYGEVTYPQSKTYCETCHTASMTHPDGDNWNAAATAKTCGGCHANGLVAQNFDAVTGVAEYQFDHGAAGALGGGFGAVANDGTCAGCHLGAISTAGPPLSIHSRISGDARFRNELGQDFIFEILAATNTGPGQTPVITFRVTDAAGTPYDIVNDPEFNDGNSALNLYVAWSTDDIYNGDELGATGSLRDRGAGPEVYEPAHPHRMYLAALQRDIAANPGWVNADGSYTVTYFTSLPNNFSGDVMISLGGHPAAVGVTDHNGIPGSQRAAATSAVFFPGAERQVAFESDKCNACHKQLQFHGTNRNGNVKMCLNCHNGDNAPDGVGEGFALGYMVHSIHAASTSFDGGRFEAVTFPQNIANCDTCHVPGSYNVPRTTARAVSIDGGADPTSWLDDAATTPTAANCGACHTSIAAMGHFNSQGGQVGALKSDILTVGGLPNGQEACAVCHGAGSEFETSQYHNPGIE